MDQNQNKNEHIPVLLEEVMQYLLPEKGESYLDLTAGYGGHAKVVLEKTKHPEKAVLVDRDQNAVSSLAQTFEGQGVEILQKDFLSASQELLADKRQFNIILADLGVSSPHLNEADRGFSLSKTGPLDMRMDRRQQLTAEKIVNDYSEAQLVDILLRYGQEPKAHQIARRIIGARPILTTTDLAKVVARAWAQGHTKIHPATRTFQALRVVVNDELALLEESLPLWIDLLAPGGRLGVISFHSLEDKLVKNVFAEAGADIYDAELSLKTKHPVMATANELVFNPRSRSAKLRVAVKINKERVLHANSGKK